MSVLVLFFDGLGLGANDPATNPFLTASMPAWQRLFGGHWPTREDGPLEAESALSIPTDATLGVAGLPQSATGQTTLLTGVNAARLLGEHLGPYPSAELRKILSEKGFLLQLARGGGRVAFANAYPPIFFERLARNKARRSAISFAVHAAGIRYRTLEDLGAGRAVSPVVTNERRPHLLPTVSPSSHNDDTRPAVAGVPIITARTAGRNLARLASENDLTLFEYFLTDVAGHKKDAGLTAYVLTEIDQLLAGVLDETDLEHSLILVTSDHGNLEDASARGHTRNPVPTFLIGNARHRLAPQIASLSDVAPAILRYFE